MAENLANRALLIVNVGRDLLAEFPDRRGGLVRIGDNGVKAIWDTLYRDEFQALGEPASTMLIITRRTQLTRAMMPFCYNTWCSPATFNPSTRATLLSTIQNPEYRRIIDIPANWYLPVVRAGNRIAVLKSNVNATDRLVNLLSAPVHSFSGSDESEMGGDEG